MLLVVVYTKLKKREMEVGGGRNSVGAWLVVVFLQFGLLERGRRRRARVLFLLEGVPVLIQLVEHILILHVSCRVARVSCRVVCEVSTMRDTRSRKEG